MEDCKKNFSVCWNAPPVRLDSVCRDQYRLSCFRPRRFRSSVTVIYAHTGGSQPPPPPPTPHDPTRLKVESV